MTGGGARTALEWAAIRRALLDLCFERGYAGVTLPMLLAQAGVSEAAFTRHFSDLDDCLSGVLEAIRKDVMARVERAADEHECWRERVRATGYVLWDFLREDQRVTHLCIIEARRAGGRAEQILNGAIDRLVDLLDQGREELEDPESLSRETAESLANRIFGLIQVAFEQDTLAAGEDTIRLLVYEAIRPYMGPDVAMQELNALVDPDAEGPGG